MQKTQGRYNKTTVKRLLPAIALLALLCSFSCAAPGLSGLLPGFSPLPPLFFCIAACMASRWTLLPAVAWTLSYFVINKIQGYEFGLHFFVVIVGLAVTFGIGATLRKKRWPYLIGGSLGAALAFYAVTNTGSWFLSEQYAKTWAGWIQCQTIGIPGYPPSWMFLKGQIAASALFTAIFLVGQRRFVRSEQKLLEPTTAHRAC